MAVAKTRKVKGRSEDQSEDFRQNKQNKQHSWLSPICIGQAQVEEKTYKRRSHTGALFASLDDIHSHLEDGFSCYLLNKIEL